MFLIKQGITVLCCMPALLATIENDLPFLRTLLVVDEACPADLVGRWLRKGRRMLKTYGPAETMLATTWCEWFPGRPITIGSLLPTNQIYVLDGQFRLAKDGESGELCIGGSGLPQPPGLTEDRFISNPAWRDRVLVPRLYRTGDIGRITLLSDNEK